jgi:fucose permease
MCLFAVVLGLGAGAVDAALNDYISLHYSAMHMNFLHCFYGVGVVVSPYVMSAMLRTASWREGYRTVFFIQSGIALLLFLSFPLWKKVRHAAAQAAEEAPRRVLKFTEMAKMPSVRLVWAVCVATNAVEAVCGIWGSSFLVLVHGLDAAAAAGAILFYYLGLALGRFLSGLVSVRLSPWRIIAIGTGILLCAVALLFVPVPAVAIAGLFLAGLGNGPIYPNIMYLTPQHFGADVSASVMGSQMAFAYGGFMAAPPLFGLLAEHFGAQLLPVYTLAWFVLLVVFSVLFRRTLKKQ